MIKTLPLSFRSGVLMKRKSGKFERVIILVPTDRLGYKFQPIKSAPEEKPSE